MSRRTILITAVAAVTLVGWIAPALARPPTVGVNPGYDRRLVESRKEVAAPGWVAIAPIRHRRHVRHRY